MKNKLIKRTLVKLKEFLKKPCWRRILIIQKGQSYQKSKKPIRAQFKILKGPFPQKITKLYRMDLVRLLRSFRLKRKILNMMSRRRKKEIQCKLLMTSIVKVSNKAMLIIWKSKRTQLATYKRPPATNMKCLPKAQGLTDQDSKKHKW